MVVSPLLIKLLSVVFVGGVVSELTCIDLLSVAEPP